VSISRSTALKICRPKFRPDLKSPRSPSVKIPATCSAPRNTRAWMICLTARVWAPAAYAARRSSRRCEMIWRFILCAAMWTRGFASSPGEYDAIILAAVGLSRLGKNQFMRHVLPAEVMCPAAGQGALAIEIRAGDFATAELVKFLDDGAARLTTTCERALLSKLGGGCQVPIGALAEVRGDRLHLDAIV